MPVLDADSAFQAAATGGSVAALVFEELPATIGRTLKIVWRVTGSGDLHVDVTRPDGSPATLSFGPEPHGASTFQRPGQEWGTGFVPDTTGCWRIDVRRGEVRALVSIEVVQPAG
jgi:hypothetical protein